MMTSIKSEMVTKRIPIFFTHLLVLVVSSALSVAAETGTEEAGIPVNDQLTIAKCAGCHVRDASGMMRRISYIRTTPEVWEESIKRMARLNGLSITPAEAGQVVRFLSNNNGLAPEEAKPVFWEAEHRLVFRNQEDGVPPPLETTCNTCHTIGRVLLQRRTRADYERLANMHMALFPGADLGVFHPAQIPPNPENIPVRLAENTGGGYGPDLAYPPVAAPASTKYPIDVALDYLATNQPLFTPEWTAWKAVMRPPKLAGTWLVNGYQKGKGRVFGRMIVESTPSPDEFTTKIELDYGGGQVETRAGKGIVYTGYSWRGRSKPAQSGSSHDQNFSSSEAREALLVSRDGGTMEGRWFWGGYQELGVDVQLIRLGNGTVVTGTDRFAVQSPSSGEIQIYGGNLPPSPRPSDFDLGPGIEVMKVTRATPTEATLQISVAPGLPAAMHDVSVHGATAVKSFAVYGKVDYIKVAPDASLARLGGTIAAKQYAQFEAIAFSKASEGPPGSPGEVSLGPVSANWSLEEFMSTPNDDDVNFVGSIDRETGLFTPSFEGPNPKRQKASNNFPTENWGDVWVDASYKAPSGQILKARAYLVVTVPSYIRYDQPEVAQ
jgi:quinohemoprotein amine dehydrogenase